MKKLLERLVGIALLISSFSAFAMPMLPSNLPAAIESCLLDFCDLSRAEFTTQISNNSITAYGFDDYRSGTLQEKVLIEYQLGSASNIIRRDNFSAETNTNITGSIWLEISRQYSLSDSLHSLSLHFDQATPTQLSTFDSAPLQGEFGLLITTDGLFASQGYSEATCCDDMDNDPIPSLFDSAGQRPIPCAAEGCFASATLNLLGLEFININNTAQLTYNTGENRRLLFSSHSSFKNSSLDGDSSYISTNTLATVVPIPAALPLFLSGWLLLLIPALKRKTQWG